VLVETSDGNGRLIDEFARAAPHPIATSLAVDVYKMLPNDGDFTILRAAGKQGLYFAFFKGLRFYHSDHDTVENLDERTVQHFGSYCLALARHFGNLKLDELQAPDAVFFNLIGTILVTYPLSWVRPLTGGIVILFLLVFALGVKRRRLTLAGMGGGLAAFILSLVAAPAVVAVPTSSGVAQALDLHAFRTRVEPIFTKPREGNSFACVGCHTTVASRFRLQPLASGATAWTEEQSRRNLESVARLVVPGEPLKSRLLLHPLAAEAGGDPTHTGGKFWQSQDDPEWRTLADWVRSASPGVKAAAAAPPPALDFETFKSRVQPIFLNKREDRARCYVCHARGAGGTGFGILPLPAGSAFWTEEESRRNFEAIQRVVVPGDPLASRLLMKPLAAEAGGELTHHGGKHWTSQDDPEWQALAAWVRGSR